MSNDNLEILAVGSALGENTVSNNELSKTIDTSDEWISSRTGIKQRHLSNTKPAAEAVVNLAFMASKKALERANVAPDDIDLIIVGTCTPGQNFPSVACRLQAKLKISDHCQAFDVTAACSGFVLGINVARGLVKIDPKIKNILIVGTEVLSSVLDWSDRSTCVLFGDGAGAIVCKNNSEAEGIIDSCFGSDGSHASLLYIDPESQFVKMNGAKIFNQAVYAMSNVITLLLKRNNLEPEDIAHFITHQANLRIIQYLAKKLQVSSDKIIITVDQHANTSAASIPLALDHAYSNDKLKKGDLILLAAFGGGLTWGGALIRWND